MELDGVSSAENERPCRVKEVDQVFSVDQMFHLLAWKLEGRDKVDQFCRPAVTAYERYRSPTRDPRYVRIADQDAKEGVARRGGDEGRSPPRAPPPFFTAGIGARQATQRFAEAVQGVKSRDTKTNGQQRPQQPGHPQQAMEGGGDQRPKSPQIPWNANQGNWNNPQGGWRPHPWQNGKGEKGKGKGKGEKGKGKGHFFDQRQSWDQGRGRDSQPLVFWFWDNWSRDWKSVNNPNFQAPLQSQQNARSSPTHFTSRSMANPPSKMGTLHHRWWCRDAGLCKFQRGQRWL